MDEAGKPVLRTPEIDQHFACHVGKGKSAVEIKGVSENFDGFLFVCLVGWFFVLFDCLFISLILLCEYFTCSNQ